MIVSHCQEIIPLNDQVEVLVIPTDMDPRKPCGCKTTCEGNQCPSCTDTNKIVNQ